MSVKAGSYTLAAGSLGLTRSAVGKSIVRLENHLGVRLLNRTTRKLSLTDEGRIMYERCLQILEDLDDVNNMMAQRRLEPTGTLKLSAPLSLGQRHVLPLVEKLLNKWPHLQVDISFTDRYVDLIEEGFDIAIRIGNPIDDSRTLTLTIASQTMLTCVAPSYLARFGKPETPAELANFDTIFFNNTLRRRVWRFETPQGPWLFDGPSRLNIDSSEAIRASALAGFGIIHLPEFLVKDDLKKGNLVTLLDGYREKPEPVRIIFPSKNHLSPRIRVFIDLIVESWRDGIC
jgi:DNA-binding transcriptional LysR family regulator